MPRFTKLERVLFAALAFGGVAAAQAQSFPAKPVTVIVPALPGGAADAGLRVIAQKVGEGLKQPLVLESRPGAAGVVGATAVKQAAPDGYTLLSGHLGQIALPSFLIANLPYDPDKDFKPITTVNVVTPFLGVPANIPAKSVAELFAYAKAKPKGLFFGHPGAGTASHLLPEMMRMTSGLPFTGVAYKGASAVMADLLEGRVDLYFGSVNAMLPLVESGRLRILAVGSAQRWEQLPDIPTMAEAGYPGHELDYWFGLFAPAGTPDAPLRAIQREFSRVLSEPDIKLAFAKQGWRAGGISTEQFTRQIADDRARWGKVIKQIGLKPE